MILVTGASGYIGGSFAQHAARAGDVPLRLLTRHQDSCSSKRAEVVKIASLDDEQELLAACRGVRHVVHLAALNDVACLADPLLALHVNTGGTLRLLRAAERAGVDRFVYVSTAHVYGAPLAGTITEQTIPRPMHPYAITHKAAEDFVMASRGPKKPLGIVIRLSNAVGPPQSTGGTPWVLLANDLCREAATRKTVTLKSSGLQQRNFVAMTDVNRAILHLLGLPQERAIESPFNVGGAHSMRVLDLAKLIVDRCHAVLGYRPTLQPPEPKPGESFASLDYRSEKLPSTGFAPAGSIESEIDETLLRAAALPN